MTQTIDTKELRYNLLLNSDDYIMIVGGDETIKFVNASFLALWNLTADNMLGRHFAAHLPDDRRKWYKAQLKQLRAEKPTISFTIKSGAADDKKWISWKATGMFDNTGTLLEILIVGRNVHESVEIRREKDHLLNTLNAFKEAIDSNIICTITDEKGVITYANRNFCEISKYTQKEIHGNTHSIVNSGHHPPIFFAAMWRTIASGKMWTGEIKNKAKDGSYYWVNSVIIPIRDSKKKISGYLSLRILINRQKEMEEEKKLYQKSLEEMLFMVSHEIRKPITTSQGLLYLMRDDKPETNDEYDEFVSHLITTTEELNEYSYKLNDYLEKHIGSQPLGSA